MHGLFRIMLLLFQIVGDFPNVFLLLISHLITLWSEDIFFYDFSPKLIENFFMAQNMTVLVNVCMHLKGMCILWFLGRVLFPVLGQVY